MGTCSKLDCKHNAQGYCGIVGCIYLDEAKTSSNTYFLWDWEETPSFLRHEILREM